MAFQTNLTIAEENRGLRNAVAAELGGEWPACWHDPSEAVKTEKLWALSFLSFVQDAGQAFPLIHVPKDTDAHDAFTLHVAIEETTHFSGIPEMARETRALPKPTPQMQASIPPTWEHNDRMQNLFASPVEVSSSCFRVPNTESPMNFSSDSRTAYDPVPREPRQVVDPEPGSTVGLVQNELPTMDSIVQRSLNSDEYEQRLPGVSVAEEELPDQPWLNSSSVPGTLPPNVTTLVVRNVPARFSPQKLLEVWSPHGTYNFLHVPYSFQRRRRLGMAFINFVSHEAATRFMATWHGQKLADGSKRMQIVAAEIQSFIENLQHLKETHLERLRNDSYMPLVFKGTCQLDVRALLAHTDFGAIGNQLDEFVLEPAVVPYL